MSVLLQPGVEPVARAKRQPKEEGQARQVGTGRQVNVRIPEHLLKRLEATADALGLDTSNFLRLMITEKLPDYERRVEELGGQKPPQP